MNDHVLDLLGAYLDGELNNTRKQKVEAHLKQCSLCLSEYEGLCRTSQLVREASAPVFTPVEKFASQVVLQLPRIQGAANSGKRGLQVWWLVPFILLGAWFFIQTVFRLSQVISLLDQNSIFRVGVIEGGGVGMPFWLGALTSLLEPLFDGNQVSSLMFIHELTTIGREALGGFFWQSAIAILYLAWLAVWWFRSYRHPGTTNQSRFDD